MWFVFLLVFHPSWVSIRLSFLLVGLRSFFVVFDFVLAFVLAFLLAFLVAFLVACFIAFPTIPFRLLASLASLNRVLKSTVTFPKASG